MWAVCLLFATENWAMVKRLTARFRWLWFMQSFCAFFSARLMAPGKKIGSTAINIQCWLKFGTELPCQHIGINNELDVSYRSMLPLSIFISSPFHLVPNQIMFPCILCVFMAIHPFLIVMNSCCIKRQVEKKNCVKLIVVPKAEMWLIK